MKASKPIFQWILFLLMVLTIVEILILVFTFMGQGLIQELNRNEMEVLSGRVDARKSYLENLIINDWMNIEDTMNQVIDQTEAYLAQQKLQPRQLDDHVKHSGDLLTQITPSLIAMMRENRVTGAYMILNCDPIPSPDTLTDKPGIYLRDADPTSLSFEQNEDILLKVSPAEVLETMQIPTDSGWDMYFRFQGRDAPLHKLLCEPFQQAWENTSHYSWRDMGYWYIPQTEEGILTYTVPLILRDGTVFGVMGLDVTFRYLDSLLPYQELGFEEQGSYIFGRYDPETDRYYGAFGNGELRELMEAGTDGFSLGSQYHVSAQTLRLYDTNTPFSSQQWVIGGVVQKHHMQAFADDLIRDVAVAVSITLLIGVLVSFLISYLLQRPISQIARELAAADPKRTLTLSPTGIREIDAISDSAMKLSRDVLENSRMFSKIVEMSSIRMSGFRLEKSTGKMFLSEDFFAVFGEPGVDLEGMTQTEFDQRMNPYEQYIIQRDDARGMYMLRMHLDGQYRYIRLRYREAQGYGYGLVEDVTQEVMERQLLQHERDHDSLTGLLNRRAFRSHMQSIMEMPPEGLKYGAMVMVDLDNLKYINDSYGHEYGDQYIIQAASSLQHATGDQGICARISGDEFNIFLYGYDSNEEVDARVKYIQEKVNAGVVRLPGEKEHAVHATGGVARFPEHSLTIETLSKYADYAMYIAKRSKKRSFQFFDPDMFHSPDIQLRNSEALTRLLQYKLVHFAFQPIVDARTGGLFAYEALMRPEVDSHFTVADVLETARRDGKLEQVEELTLYETLETFSNFLRNGQIPQDAYLFVNSIANVVIGQEKGEPFVAKYEPQLRRLVLELTEEEKINKDCWEVKQGFHRALGGKIALDDYGSGYNSEKTLLDISPDFIKVDMSIIRDIHLNKDKQTIVSNIVHYAHERGKFIIAEGVEKAEEVRQLVAMDVDYMQGYFFGKPQRIPEDISPQGKATLQHP